MNTFRLSLIAPALAALVFAQGATPLHAASVPDNLGLGLRELVERSQQDQLALRNQLTATPRINADTANRVVANIQLDGKAPVADVEARLAALGLEVIAVDDHWRNGVISVWLPLASATVAANLPGVR